MNMRPAVYVKGSPSEHWFCTTHKRRATHIRERDGHHCCDPSLGGITIPCQCVLIVDGPSRVVEALLPGMIA